MSVFPEAISLGSSPVGGGGDPEDKVRQALELIREAIQLETDEQDRLLLERIATQCQQYISMQQKLVDTATGAGPGAKLVRKAQSRSTASY